MERMIKLREINSGINNFGAYLQCEFIENKLVIAIPSKTNLFERSSIFGNVLTLKIYISFETDKCRSSC